MVTRQVTSTLASIAWRSSQSVSSSLYFSCARFSLSLTDKNAKLRWPILDIVPITTIAEKT